MPNNQTIALAVSGGGYRATLYSLGALWRLNEFGLLPRLSMITGVSGGSILTAWLALRWDDLSIDASGVATNFEEVIAQPIQVFCSKSIDVKSLVSAIFSRETVGDKLAKAYDRGLFKGARLESIPRSAPEFIFYGTSLQTGASVRIQKKELSDYKIGTYPNPNISLAQAVGISSAFPPMLSPVTLKLNPAQWRRSTLKGFSEYFNDERLRGKLFLADGGLYDNLGLEAVWKGNFSHVICCDAGTPFGVDRKPRKNWISQFKRMTDIMVEQQRALRKRILIARYIDKKFGGTYFGLSTEIENYQFDDSMTSDSSVSAALATLRTRLNAFNKEEQGRLMNWGYALTDTAIRRHSPDLLTDELNKRGNWIVPEYTL